MGFSVAKMETVLSKLGWLVTLVSERARTFRVGRTWFSIPALLLKSSVAMGKLFNLSDP